MCPWPIFCRKIARGDEKPAIFNQLRLQQSRCFQNVPNGCAFFPNPKGFKIDCWILNY